MTAAGIEVIAGWKDAEKIAVIARAATLEIAGLERSPDLAVRFRANFIGHKSVGHDVVEGEAGPSGERWWQCHTCDDWRDQGCPA